VKSENHYSGRLISFYYSLAAITARLHWGVFVLNRSQGPHRPTILKLCKRILKKDFHNSRFQNLYGIPTANLSDETEDFDEDFLQTNLWGFIDHSDHEDDKTLISPVDPGFPSAKAAASGCMVSTAKMYQVLQCDEDISILNKIAIGIMIAIETILYMPAFLVWLFAHALVVMLGFIVMIIAAIHEAGRKCFAENKATTTFYIGSLIFVLVELLKVSIILWLEFFIVTWILGVKLTLSKVFPSQMIATPRLQMYFLPPLCISSEKRLNRRSFFRQGKYWSGLTKLVADLPYMSRTFNLSAVRTTDQDNNIKRSQVFGHGFEWPINCGPPDDVGLSG